MITLMYLSSILMATYSTICICDLVVPDWVYPALMTFSSISFIIANHKYYQMLERIDRLEKEKK